MDKNELGMRIIEAGVFHALSVFLMNYIVKSEDKNPERALELTEIFRAKLDASKPESVTSRDTDEYQNLLLDQFSAMFQNQNPHR